MSASTSIVRSILGRNRELTFELARREVLERYAGSALGGAWSLLAPLLTMALYVFLFGFVFPARFGSQGSPWPGAALILAALVPWLALVEVATRAPAVFTSQRSLVRQVVFPIEVLPARLVAATLVPWAVGIAVSLAVAVAAGGVKATMLLLPALWALQALGMLGLALLLAPLGAWLRDTKDVVAFLASAGLFAAPILLLPATIESLPRAVQVALLLNPATHMALVHRDALVAGSFEHPASWIVFPATCLALLAVGSAVFARARHAIAEVV